MLILIGLLLIYIDIYVGSIDVVPDLIGYILMIPGFFAERSRIGSSRSVLYTILLALLMHLGGMIPSIPFILEILLYLAEAVSVFLLGWFLLKDYSNGSDPEEASVSLRISLIRTSLWCILLVTVFAVPISAFLPVIGTVIRILSSLCGLYVVAMLYLMRQNRL